MQAWVHKQKGFTIVELLIVIVVIAILAAISIVAYNGIQQRAKATALADGLTKVDKAFRLTAIQEGWSSWPVYGNNPTLAYLIANTPMKNNLQQSPQIPGITDASWEYDNDGDAFSGCSLSTAGASMYLPIEEAVALQVDKSIDDGDFSCGKIRYHTASGKIRLVIGEGQATSL